MAYGRNNRFSRWGCLLLAAHFAVVFCAADFLHADDCEYVSGVPLDADDGCAACLFKLGANAEQPEFVTTLASFFLLEEQLAILVQTVQSNGPSCCLPLRAPPA